MRFASMGIGKLTFELTTLRQWAAELRSQIHNDSAGEDSGVIERRKSKLGAVEARIAKLEAESARQQRRRQTN